MNLRGSSTPSARWRSEVRTDICTPTCAEGSRRRTNQQKLLHTLYIIECCHCVAYWIERAGGDRIPQLRLGDQTHVFRNVVVTVMVTDRPLRLHIVKHMSTYTLRRPGPQCVSGRRSLQCLGKCHDCYVCQTKLRGKGRLKFHVELPPIPWLTKNLAFEFRQ